MPANQTLVLAPGGYHLMLLKTTQPLKEGETFPCSLTFKNGGGRTQRDGCAEGARPRRSAGKRNLRFRSPLQVVAWDVAAAVAIPGDGCLGTSNNSGDDVMRTAVVGLALLALAATGARAEEAQPLAGPDTQFLAKAIQDGMAEVDLGKTAEKKASSPEVKRFAEHMVKDHSAANKKLEALAKKHKIEANGPRTRR